MKYRTNTQAWFGTPGVNGGTYREEAEFDSLMSARRHFIQEIAKKRYGYAKMENNWYVIRFGKNNESIQAVNDGRANYICVKRGPGGNKSYLQILNPKGEPVSPKMSVYAFEVGWKNGLKWYYKYRQ